MFDIWIGDVELTRCVLIFSLVVLLPLQLLLCFKVKRKGIRLIPVTLFFVLAAVLAMISAAVGGRTGLVYLFLAMFSGFMLLICGAGWGIWAVFRLIQQKKSGDRPMA